MTIICTESTNYFQERKLGACSKEEKNDPLREVVSCSGREKSPGQCPGTSCSQGPALCRTCNQHKLSAAMASIPECSRRASRPGMLLCSGLLGRHLLCGSWFSQRAALGTLLCSHRLPIPGLLGRYLSRGSWFSQPAALAAYPSRLA